MVYGIDLGHTYSAIAKLDNNGTPVIIENMDSAKPLMASAVYFCEDGSIIVGDEAREEGQTNPANLMQFFKRWIGRDSDPEREIYKAYGKEYTPVQLSAMVLERIKKYAWEAGEDVNDVVITVPAYFDYAQRDATKEAGRLAGLNVIAVINEPTAAAIAYAQNAEAYNETILVYDLGGSTFDVTLLQITVNGEGNRDVNVLAADGDSYLGGCDWDEHLFRILKRKFDENFGQEVYTDVVEYAIRGSVESIKMRLSLKSNITAKIDCDGEKISLDISREEFEAETVDLAERTFNWVTALLDEAGLSDYDVDAVILAGGSSRMPMIKERMAERFGDKVFGSVPGSITAKGAAIIAGIWSPHKPTPSMWEVRIEKLELDPDLICNKEEITELDFDPPWGLTELQGMITYDPDPTDLSVPIICFDRIPKSYGVIAGKYNEAGDIIYFADNIIKADTVVPAEAERTYVVRKSGVTKLYLPIVENVSAADTVPVLRDKDTGDFVFPDSSLKIRQRGKLELPLLPGTKPGSEIVVKFSIDLLGTVNVSLTDKNTGISAAITFDWSSKTDEAGFKDELGGKSFLIDF